jgi:predicted LPLAT superfamily acyltransferase
MVQFSTRIRTADDLLAALARQRGMIVSGAECGPSEVAYALAAGRGYVNAAGDAFVLRARRTMERAAELNSARNQA